MKIDMKCKECGKAKSLVVDGDKFDHYLRGALIDNVFPEMDRADVNYIIKGLCPECIMVPAI